MIEPLHGYGSRILAGITRWVRANPGWRLSFFDGERDELVQLVNTWDGDGIICSITDDDMARSAASRSIPVVNIAGRAQDFGGEAVPSITSDDRACGKMAATYLRERGLTHYAFVGSTGAHFSRLRLEGYRNELQAHRHAIHEIDIPLGDESSLAETIAQLPRPLGIYCPTDRRAASVLEACYLARLDVPEEVVVLGTGDHTHLCELCTPTLSSIDCDMERRGLEAADHLDALMRGEAPSTAPIEPLRVVTRASTDSFAFGDDDLAAALSFIRRQASEPIKVSHVVDATSIARRSLETRFQKYLGRTIHDEIWRVHHALAQQLLTTTDHDLATVAQLSGFGSATSFATAFKAETGLTPRTYRAANRR